MFRHFTQFATAIGLALFLSGVAHCQSRWEFGEVFSTADGSIQFVVFDYSSGCCEPLPVLAGQTLVAGDGKAEHRFTFAHDVNGYGDFEGQKAWGTLTFTFSDCNHAHVDWASTLPGYGSGGMDLVRLTLPAGLTCPWCKPLLSKRTNVLNDSRPDREI